MINFSRERTRGRRNNEVPHTNSGYSCTGLRRPVIVGPAAGVVYVGADVGMLDALGIRSGVEDEGMGSSGDEGF